YMVGTHVDVQTLKETEFALRRSELELTEAKRIARLGHWFYDIPCGTVHWSNEIYELIGLEPSQEPVDWETFLSYVPPQDHPALHQAIDRTLNQGEPYEIEHRLTTPDGSQRILQARGYAEFDAAGNPQILRGTAQDVTEQRTLQHELAEREAHYRDL
ncbi:PAS domain-containing protein, partial [Halorhodospira sp. 9621]|uniref:PAS domain-containing protein n=1 Tax=Halorhodospira sp. 9621 TaxID=2899135 RepID=UPI001EE80EF7